MAEEKNILDHLKPRKVNVPENAYFRELAANVSESESKKASVIPLFKRRSTWLSAAAVAAVVIIILPFLPGTQPDTNPLQTLRELGHDDVVAYVDENIDEFNLDMIIQHIPHSNLDAETKNEPETPDSDSTATTTTTVPEPNLDDIDVDDILEYLMKEGYDPDERSEDEEIFI